MNAVSEASAAFPYHLPVSDSSLEEATLQQRAVEQHTNQPSLSLTASRRQGCRDGEHTGCAEAPRATPHHSCWGLSENWKRGNSFQILEEILYCEGGGTCCPQKLWVLHPWKCFRPGWGPGEYPNCALWIWQFVLFVGVTIPQQVFSTSVNCSSRP